MIIWILILVLILLNISLFFVETIKNEVVNFIARIKLPGPASPNFIVGNATIMYTSPEKMFVKLRKLNQLYYPIYTFRAFNLITVQILHPDDFELVLSNSKHIDKSIAYNVMHNWLGTGLLTSNGNKWFNRRKILTPAFHFNILQQFLRVFNEETKNLVDTIKNLDDKTSISVNNHITQFTLKTVTETAMGTKLNFTSSKEVLYRQAIADIGEILLYRHNHPWFINEYVNVFCPSYFKEKETVKILHDFSRDVISQRKKEFETNDFNFEDNEVYTGKKKMAMLDLLLSVQKEQNAIDEAGICEEVDTFIFEGHDTTASALIFALMLLACNSKVQELIIEEIKFVTGDLLKTPTYTELQEMKYLERVIKEVLRLYPSVPIISRQLGEELTTSSGYKLPKNTILHLHIYDLHRNPDFYPDPEKFDPDRFLPENCKNRHKFAYLPFSAGPRNCIGQKFAMLELKAVICGILTNFILEPIDTPESIVFIIDIILKTKNNIKVKFVPRNVL